MEVSKRDMVKKTQQVNNDGLPPPMMQRVPIDKGATVPLMQPVTQTNQTVPPATDGSSSPATSADPTKN
jgi:hypothetical protein